MNNRAVIVNLGIIALMAAMVLSVVSFTFSGISLSANSGSTNVVATVNVQSTCVLAVSNSAINFFTVNPGTSTGVGASGNVVSDTNNGNVGSYIWISGSNWIGVNIAVNFFVANTIYSNSFNNEGAGYLFNSVGLATGNTGELVSTGATNTLYFGVNIPNGQTANSYTQNVVINNVC
ncbi:MAG: hypothetical protein KGH53_01975 [Candidatus Micrarchaeota archaeon]|nr:hypothetical protein [Candidatus Micrarchaeota archaeon]